MPLYVRGFVIPEVGDVHVAYKRVIAIALENVTLAIRSGVEASLIKDQLARLEEGYRIFQVNLQAAAVTGAAAATVEMRDKFRSTVKRVETTGNGPSLVALLVARPLTIPGFATGAVGVADVALLDTAINPNSRYGPYWRAQEYGTGADSPEGPIRSQKDRVIFGAFFGGGESSPPIAEYAGGGGPHPIFISHSDSPSDTPGFGTIGMEIAGRHFIRDGADAALLKWRADIARAQSEAISALSQVI